MTLTERVARLFAEAQGLDPDAPPKPGKPAPAWQYETDYAAAAIRAVLADLRDYACSASLSPSDLDDYEREHLGSNP